MIDRELQKIVLEERAGGRSDAYIQNLLKEYLQVYVLYYVYTNSHYKQNLIFTGGTCLRHFYGLPRLSVDLDFDCLIDNPAENLMAGLKDFFTQKYKYPDVSGSTKQQGRQVLLKFPVLKKLDMASGGKSDLLYVRVDLSPIPSQNYSAMVSTKSSYGMNYAARHYDLPSLMAGKLHAILTRRYLQGAQVSIKGRDYFDLLWFVKKGVRPNLGRLSDMLQMQMTLIETGQRVDEKVHEFVQKHRKSFESDMTPLVSDSKWIESYVEHYQEEYLRCRNQSFSDKVDLSLVCQKCGKRFYSGISLDQSIFESMQLEKNIHTCPFCGYKNNISKGDYVVEPSTAVAHETLKA